MFSILFNPRLRPFMSVTGESSNGNHANMGSEVTPIDFEQCLPLNLACELKAIPLSYRHDLASYHELLPLYQEILKIHTQAPYESCRLKWDG